MRKIPIKLIENHDQAYYIWKKHGILNKPLVHLDAHIDFNFHYAKTVRQAFEETSSKKDLVQQLCNNLFYKELSVKEDPSINIDPRPTIENYIYPAVRDGIVSDFYWVVPGKRQEFRKSLKNLRNILKSFFPRDLFKAAKFTEKEGILAAKIYGRDFIVTTLEDLPGNITGAILDIDTDYLTTDTVRKADASQGIGKRFPWIWPEELVGQLKKKRIRPCCVTIAYSVNGGFTPLIYKFLGDEVAIFFNNTNERLKGVILMKKKALVLFGKGEIKEAIDMLKGALQNLDVVRVNPGLKNRLRAHIGFVLFRCFTTLKDITRARPYYNIAIRSDRTYRVKDNNYGPLYLRRKEDLKKAEQEFNIILSVDRDNTHAVYGVAYILIKQKDFKKAKRFLKKAYMINSNRRKMLLDFARLEVSAKNYRMALRYLKDYISKYKMQKPVYLLLAQAYEKLGMSDKALEEYRHISSFGVSLGIYLRFFRLLRKTGIPKKHSEWIEDRIDAYRRYRRIVLNSQKAYPRALAEKAGRTIGEPLNRIDTILEKVEKEKDPRCQA